MPRLTLALLALHACASAAPIAEVDYDRFRVIHVPVARGVATHVELEPGETINTAAVGIGADCANPEHPWCIEWQEGGAHIFAKPRQGSGPSNTMELVTNKRSMALLHKWAEAIGKAGVDSRGTLDR